MQPLLKMEDVHVQYVEPSGKRIHALNGVTLQIRPGQVLGLLGESGSGKSTLGKALLRMLPNNAQVVSGTIEFEGKDLMTLREDEVEKVRGSRIAMIPQEPGLALSPVMKVGNQIGEVLRAHHICTSSQRRERAETLLSLVHLESAGRSIYDAYPHQLSGGQQQRVAIAQALACQPALVIADESTSSLDSTTEAEILRLLSELKTERKMALLLISTALRWWMVLNTRRSGMAQWWQACSTWWLPRLTSCH